MVNGVKVMFGVVFAFASAAQANESNVNALSLSEGGLPANFIEQKVEGNDNRLLIEQSLFDSTGLGNRIEVSISGNGNGGLAEGEYPALFQSTGMTPGKLVQSGAGNSMRIDVNGSFNLFAASQVGQQNQLTAFVSGSSNQFSVQQSGQGNIAHLSQIGNGNIISIIQQSR